MTVSPTRSLFDKFITSRDNAVFNTLADCVSSRGIKKHGLFLVAGEKAIHEILNKWPQLVRNLVIPLSEHEAQTSNFSSSPWRDLILQVRQKNAARNDTKTSQAGQASDPIAVIALIPILFNEVDVTGTKRPLLVLKTPDLPVFDLSHPPRGIEILCALGDPSNLGALIRSAAAFQVSRVVLLKECATPFHPKAVRAASGATLSVPLARGPSIHDLTSVTGRHNGADKNASMDLGQVVALDMHGTPVQNYKWPENVRILLGEEGTGLPQSALFSLVSIPMAPEVESLNATVALSIALFTYRSSFPV